MPARSPQATSIDEARTRSSADPDDPVDLSLVRWMLSLSHDERLQVLQGFVDGSRELKLVRAG